MNQPDATLADMSSVPRQPPDDETTFRALFTATYDDLLRFVERRVPMAAEDVVADVFLVAWRRLDDVPREISDARAWLFTVAHRTLQTHRRSDQRRQNLAQHLVRVTNRENGDHGDADVESVAARLDLSRAWQRLRAADREVLTLTTLDGLTQREAARVLGITTAAVSLRVLRARRRLSKYLPREPSMTARIPSSDPPTSSEAS